MRFESSRIKLQVGLQEHPPPPVTALASLTLSPPSPSTLFSLHRHLLLHTADKQMEATQFSELTGAPPATAAYYLSTFGSLDAAISGYFDSGGTQPPASAETAAAGASATTSAATTFELPSDLPLCEDAVLAAELARLEIDRLVDQIVKALELIDDLRRPELGLEGCAHLIKVVN